MAVDSAKLIDMYRMMVRIRTFEDRVAQEFASGAVPGAAHLYSGEEAVATGACANLRLDDYITSTHRGHGHLLAKGGQTDKMMAEIFGKKTGYNKGKGGSMHIAAPEIGILGASGIVAGLVPVAPGAGLSAKMRGTDQVTICFVGDGTTNSGRFHESVNLSACWNLPVIYVIENNLYAESTRISATCKLVNLSDRAAAYGIPGKTVDGMDVLAVFQTVGEAVSKARKGEGPSMIECKTYRYHGHFGGDPQTYKPKEEVEEWLKKDPIPRYRKYLIDNAVLTQEEVDTVNEEVAEEIEKAVKFAKESPYPAPEEALEDVFA